MTLELGNSLCIDIKSEKFDSVGCWYSGRVLVLLMQRAGAAMEDGKDLLTSGAGINPAGSFLQGAPLSVHWFGMFFFTRPFCV